MFKIKNSEEKIEEEAIILSKFKKGTRIKSAVLPVFELTRGSDYFVGRVNPLMETEH